jgi:hypothetical protein
MILIEVLLGTESFYMISTISFTCLIIIEFLNIFTEVTHYLFRFIESKLRRLFLHSCLSSSTYYFSFCSKMYLMVLSCSRLLTYPTLSS